MHVKTSSGYGNWRLKSALAKSLLAITFMNLNGFAYMLLGVNQVFSLALLFFSVALIILHRRITLNSEFVWFLSLILGYILFGMLFIPVFKDPQAGIGDLPTLAGTIVLIVAIVQHIQNMRGHSELREFFIFARNIALVSATANLFSGFLYPLYVNPPPSAAYRSAGLFANPNDAGLMGTLAVALLILYPIRPRMLSLMAFSLASAATIITFSRGAIMILLVMLLISVWTSRSWKRLILVPVGVIAPMSLLFFTTDIVSWLETQAILELDSQQLERLVVLTMIIDGQIDTETTGGRGELLAFALSKAYSVFPLGTGLGSFQALEGGLRGGRNQWLGAHNSILMIWGESGILMLLVLIGFLVTVVKNSARRRYWEQGAFLLLVFLGSAMFSHEVFSLRFINVVTAFMIAQSLASYRLRPDIPPSQSAYQEGSCNESPDSY